MTGVQETWELLSKKLGAIDKIKHVDLWNRNIEFIDEDEAWERPAVFVEFGPIEWSPLKVDAAIDLYRGHGKVMFHVVTDWDSEKYNRAWRATRHLRLAIHEMVEEGYLNMVYRTTRTNHDHGDILESIEEYGISYLVEVPGSDDEEDATLEE